MRKLEREVTQLMLDSAGALLPDRHGDASFRVFLDATLALMRGLAMTRAVDGARVVERRWQAIKPHLLALAAR